MKLKEAKVYKFKTYETEQIISFEDDYTALVGMNESGKTCLLEAITKANSYKGDSQFSKIDDYPRKFKKKLDKSGENPIAIELVFKLDDEERNFLSEFTYENYSSFEFKYIKYYDNTILIEFITSIDYKKIFQNQLGLQFKDYDALLNFNKNEYDSYITSLNEDENNDLILKLRNFQFAPKDKLSIQDRYIEHIKNSIIIPNIPKILYYDEYAILPSKVSLDEIKNSTNSSYKTANALLEISNIDINKLNLNDANFEEYRSEIEATEAYITDEILKNWSTNKNLSFKFDLSNSAVQNYNVKYTLNVRIYNSRTCMTLPFSARSKGFTWFVSFLVWFKKLQEDKSQNVIILLDEPGLNLHAKAQNDLLKFIRNLSKSYQVIYTTHSPFMIETEELNKIRTIKFDDEKGSVVLDSVQQKDPNTLFPLQAALGYDIAQNLFISQNNLIVEGIADLVYLNYMSSLLKEKGKESLNEKITIVPVGGADKVTSFISLLRGNELNLVCLLDTLSSATSQKMQHLVNCKLLESKKILTYESIIAKKYADVEDLFAIGDYIKLYNSTTNSSINYSVTDKFQKGIVAWIENSIQNKFNHFSPAKYLISHPEFELSDETITNFEKVIKKINSLF